MAPPSNHAAVADYQRPPSPDGRSHRGRLTWRHRLDRCIRGRGTEDPGRVAHDSGPSRVRDRGAGSRAPASRGHARGSGDPGTDGRPRACLRLGRKVARTPVPGVISSWHRGRRGWPARRSRLGGYRPLRRPKSLRRGRLGSTPRSWTPGGTATEPIGGSSGWARIGDAPAGR